MPRVDQYFIKIPASRSKSRNPVKSVHIGNIEMSQESVLRILYLKN